MNCDRGWVFAFTVGIALETTLKEGCHVVLTVGFGVVGKLVSSS
jgi:hypothetical protein